MPLESPLLAPYNGPNPYDSVLRPLSVLEAAIAFTSGEDLLLFYITMDKKLREEAMEAALRLDWSI